MRIRTMTPGEKERVAELIFQSTNTWYERAGKGAIFRGGAESCLLFPEVYEDLDPGCCLVAEDESSSRLMGSCFYHPRETHVSLGIMNVHSDFFGRGVAGKLLARIIEIAKGKPIRLVSSAMNLDSYSLYTRAGFAPRAVFQDVLFSVSVGGIGGEHQGVRAATLDDIPVMVELEERVSGIRREKDFAYFIENARGIWHVSVAEDARGGIKGFLCSVNHPGSNMIGPGVMENDEAAVRLIRAELDWNRGRSPVMLVPAERGELVRRVYEMGGRNCEIHFAQCRGEYSSARGVVMPTFMPETG